MLIQSFLSTEKPSVILRKISYDDIRAIRMPGFAN